GPVTVVNGTAIVSGTVAGSGAVGQLTVNGQPVSLDAAGNFTGVVSLDGDGALDFALGNSTGPLVDLSVPVALAGPGGIIPGSVVDAVEQAGATLLQPAGGFVGGQPLTVAGSVADKGQLAALAVNGTDGMRLLGADQTFSVQVPDTPRADEGGQQGRAGSFPAARQDANTREASGHGHRRTNADRKGGEDDLDPPREAPGHQEALGILLEPADADAAAGGIRGRPG